MINKRNLMIGIAVMMFVAVVLSISLEPKAEAGQTGGDGGPIYETVHHPAVTHEEKVWVVDQAAWDETVVTGYVCSGCGATK